jgi:hypothetical protein
MINILIIGVGKIGAYHLLSMINLRESCNIYLYDPCKNAIDNALEIFEDGLKLNPKKKKIIKPIVIFQLEDLPPIFDFCIISTSSKVRKGVLIALLRNTKLFIKIFLLEKFLFQNVNEYSEVLIEIKKNEAKVFVNEWMSNSHIFRRISHWLDTNDPDSFINMNVTGSSWGLGCNSVHFIDLFHYLIKRQKISLISSQIKTHTASKREGYIEFFGKLTIRGDEGSNLFIESSIEGDTSYIELSFMKKNANVYCKLWNDNLLEIRYKNKSIELSEQTYLPYQSELTHEIIHQAVTNQQINLPTINEATLHHLLVCESLQNYCSLNLSQFKQDVPIT